METPIILLASPQMADLAKKVAALSPRITLGKIEWRQFPDGFPDTFIHDKEALLDAHVAFLACFDTPHTIFEQLSVIHDLAEYRPRSLKILLPYFPTGTMERKDHEGQVATASSLAHMLSAIPPSGPGPVPLTIWDIHALPIRHYFGAHIAPRFKTGTKLLKERLAGRDVTIIFPDEGAWKRYRVMFQDEAGKDLFPLAMCRKVRKGNERIITVAEGDVAGKDVVIVDDLIHSGGTTIKCAEALKTCGARTVSVYATHGVMEHDAWKKFVGVGIEKVWITDSCPATAKAVEGIEPFEVLSLAGSVSRAILQGAY